MVEYIEEYTEQKRNDTEEKRESLLVLASLGMTKEYLGEELSNSKIDKLSQKDIEKYFFRYQTVSGKRFQVL